MIFESIIRPVPRLAAVLRDITPLQVANAVVAFVFAASAPIAIILAVGAKGNLSAPELASWIFGVFLVNGVVSIGFCLMYRQPLVFFWTIPGTVLLGPSLEHLSFPEAIGAFYATGGLMLALGLSGWMRRIMQAVPMPIVMAMVAGVFLQFVLDWVLAFAQSFWIAASMTVAFVAFSASSVLGRRLPPLIAALVVGALAVALTGTFQPQFELEFQLASPILFSPVFSWRAIVELVIPLAISVLVVQNGQGFAVLTAAGHEPPLNSITTACGIASFFAASVGAISSCLTGPVSGILTSAGEREQQYAGGVLVGLLALVFALFAPIFTALMLAAPAAFIATLAGIALVRVLENSFKIAFADRYTLGAIITFVVTFSGVSIFNISAPFWGLVFGFLTSWTLERKDFARR